MKVAAVIPARYGSRRFPGKALVPVGGVPLIVRVATRVWCSGVADEVLVATDDERIARAVAAVQGVQVELDAGPFRCGSDRVAAAVARRGWSCQVVLNVQGDEALVDAEVLRGALRALGDERAPRDIGTVAVPIRDAEELSSPDVVKVIFDAGGRARAFVRQLPGADADVSLADAELGAHVGIYAFRPAALRRFAALPPSVNETRADLEQLRAMDAGMSIGVFATHARLCAVNRPDDVPRAEALLDHQPVTPAAPPGVSQRKEPL